MGKAGYVYILASRPNGAIYIGVTSNLAKRLYQHRHSLVEGHTKRYDIKALMYFEAYDDISEAILREKRLKKWRREWKVGLIEQTNPTWRDLTPDIT
jgi:putative endonuclease